MPASNVWSITNKSAAGVAASATRAAPASAASSGMQVRVRGIQAYVAGSGASGEDTLVVRDGATGVGTIIFSAVVSVALDREAWVELNSLDLRASVGNALTVEFTTGIALNPESVNAQGDFVPSGAPYGG